MIYKFIVKGMLLKKKKIYCILEMILIAKGLYTLYLHIHIILLEMFIEFQLCCESGCLYICLFDTDLLGQ